VRERCLALFGRLLSQGVFLCLALAASAWGALVLLTGGFSWDAGSIRFSSRDATRPLAAALVCVVCHLLWERTRAPRRVTTLAGGLAVLTQPRWLVAAGAVAVAAVGIAYGVDAVGATDSYGYASQARLWLTGSVVVEQPFVVEWPWPDAAPTATPPGYVPRGTTGTVVPFYSPGFPMVLALAEAVGGAEAIFLVVPLLAGLAVWLTFGLGRYVADETVGLIAAFWLMTSPAFLFMLVMAPMSDIPAMTWWLLSVVLVLRDGPTWTLVLSGVAASVAVLTRSNLVFLSAFVAALVALRAALAGVGVGPSVRVVVRRVTLWVLPALAGPTLIAWLNARLYGSPFVSGYGRFSDLFAWAHVGPNVRLYAGWLVDSQTPVILLAVAAPLALMWARDTRTRVVTAGWCVLCAATIAGTYLWYSVFDTWFWTLRFLLPGYPMLLVAAAVPLVALARRLGRPGLAGLAVLVVLVGRHGVSFTDPEWLWAAAQREYRYREAGERLRQLPANAVVLAELHSGSVRYYASVLTLRLELLDPAWLDRAVAHFAAAGRPVFAVLDEEEVELYRARFSSKSSLRWLQGPPLNVTAGVATYAVAPASGP
jgi:hypothetical protein